ncbi:sigma-70 family RNA polymerase sigma factor [Promicromonospora sp. MEB111]|uniref:zf-HC2 domain-containing protein n=1 Tax=Promicromonospora sp. MEB111 TaxID=3040301 RepID=UPI00254BAFB4|nr:sigma-70 family RNA polymerase sigma factor [Promicromonospora sp. MEB111]
MTAARAMQLDDWVVHRPNVVRSVAARVPGIDAEEATSRALEKMVRIVSTGGTIDDPAPYWRRAAVNEAISMTREAGRARPVEDDTLDALTPPVAGAELDAEREADVSMLRSALSDLADDDRKILLDRHVHDMAVADIAGDLGVRPHAVTMRLRRAEERLAGAFAAAHAQTVNEPECRTTRAAMHDYLKERLLPRRRARVEAHMDGCAECTRAFTDVREVSWMLRDLGQHLVASAVATGALGAAAAGAAGAGAGAGAGAAGAAGGAKPSFGKKEAAIVAGVLAALAFGGGAAALVANQPDDPPAAESVANPGGGGGGGGADGGGGGGGGGGADGAGSGDGTGSDVGGGGDDGAGSGDGADDNGSTAVEDSARDIAGTVSTWLDNLGTPSDSSDDGVDTATGDGAPADSPSGPDSTADGAEGDGGRSDNNGGGAVDSNSGSDGPSNADGARPGFGAELSDWFTRLGIAGIPAFLLLVFLLWLWDRWSRADD